MLFKCLWRVSEIELDVVRGYEFVLEKHLKYKSYYLNNLHDLLNRSCD